MKMICPQRLTMRKSLSGKSLRCVSPLCFGEEKCSIRNLDWRFWKRWRSPSMGNSFWSRTCKLWEIGALSCWPRRSRERCQNWKAIAAQKKDSGLLLREKSSIKKPEQDTCWLACLQSEDDISGKPGSFMERMLKLFRRCSRMAEKKG